MGSKRGLILTYIMLNIAWSWTLVHGNNNDSLDYYFYNYALQKIHNPRTAKLYNVSLPANLSGVELSFARLRTHSLWKSGTHYSSFTIPNSTSSWPPTERIDIVYHNLGNWSSSYYYVPNHTFVTPIVGFQVYNSNTTSTSYGPVELQLMGENPIIIDFSRENLRNIDVRMKCVRFDSNGTMELSNLSTNGSCIARKQGHFCVVIPNEPHKDNVIKRRMIVEVMGGSLVLILVFVVCVVGYDKWIKGKRVEKMDRISEISMAVDTIWIGRSRMPFAAGTRTCPVIEHRYVP